ncbi:Helicase conserved C-terminal domain containing protein, putative [Angomonas deanei]|uniref:Helicase conserved C-terminal domain containing protein, putative n=1 Tax=Angomonas deanei TaxID=59799 RepID=A0A7G2CKG3_9TRYP|nr:Helicase conserved C-terminal domain containing protein, putative [Angomonas deanei]
MRAGGVGITITAATRVILFDFSFNPSDEKQSISRAYRYGQVHQVYVYRFISYCTLEYFVFQTKLAKEWLQKLIVEEQLNMKREGLSGLRLTTILRRMISSLKYVRSFSHSVFEKDESPILEELPQQSHNHNHKITSQRRQTQNIIEQDVFLQHMLSAAPHLLLFAQEYNTFFEEEDNNEDEKEEEKAYEDYLKQKQSMWGAADHDKMLSSSHEDDAILKLRRLEEEENIKTKSKTLSEMILNILRERNDAESGFDGILAAMRGNQNNNNKNNVNADDDLLKRLTENAARQQQENNNNNENMNNNDNLPFSLSDSEEECEIEIPSEQPPQKKNNNNKFSFSINPEMYKPYEPGKKKENAIVIQESPEEL